MSSTLLGLWAPFDWPFLRFNFYSAIFFAVVCFIKPQLSFCICYGSKMSNIFILSNHSYIQYDGSARGSQLRFLSKFCETGSKMTQPRIDRIGPTLVCDCPQQFHSSSLLCMFWHVGQKWPNHSSIYMYILRKCCAVVMALHCGHIFLDFSDCSQHTCDQNNKNLVAE